MDIKKNLKVFRSFFDAGLPGTIEETIEGIIDKEVERKDSVLLSLSDKSSSIDISIFKEYTPVDDKLNDKGNSILFNLLEYYDIDYHCISTNISVLGNEEWEKITPKNLEDEILALLAGCGSFTFLRISNAAKKELKERNLLKGGKIIEKLRPYYKWYDNSKY